MDYEFTTDGCSGGMTWAWRKVFHKDPPWNDRCVDHDRTYHAGGTRKQRLEADLKLMIDIASSGHHWFAIAMFVAVRLGGHPLLPFSWRWGYGWKYPRGYEENIR